MIAVRLEGRLGNQMFQYAFIYNASTQLKTNFYLDKSIDDFLLPKYFKINCDFVNILDKYLFSITGFKNFFKFYIKRAFYNFLPHLFQLKQVIIVDNDGSNDQYTQKLLDRCLYIGYFQSEIFFRENSQSIKSIFTIKDFYKNQFQHIISKLPLHDKLVVVHVRRGDYLSIGYTFDNAYYHKAIQSVNCEGFFFVFVSDDTNFVKVEFDYLPNKFVSNFSEIIDLQLLIHADVCILTKSSFSWWGAYLNENNAKVIIPDEWFYKGETVRTPKDFVLDNWISL